MKTSQVIIKTFKFIFFTVLLALIALIVVLSLSFKDLKSVANKALNGKNYLETSIVYAGEKNWTNALEENTKAQEEIDSSLQLIDKLKNKLIFSKIAFLQNQIIDLEYLLKTASLISHSLDQALPLAKSLDEIYMLSSEHSFSSLPVSKKAEFFQIIYESEPEISGLRANIELAKINLSRIRKIGILYPVYREISDLKEKLETVSNLLVKTAPLTRLLPALAGYPSPSDFLIIMHNNDELRPSGGFIGVFGLLKSENGEIQHLKTYDSYHLDMPAVGNWEMEPPAPIKKYMNVQNWYLRDANWSPNWPTSAQKIQEIYYGESKAINQPAPNFSGVIGVTPQFVSDLLSLVGPIEINNEVYTPENLQPLLQYSVEVAYIDQDISQWDRKQVINDLLEELKNRLMKMSVTRLPDFLAILEDNILTKDLQMYFNNSVWQSLVKELGASGEIKKTDSDYLLVVDANLAAFKSDSVMKKDIEYRVSFENNSANASLDLSYMHDGGFDWRTTRYRSYTRVYAPKGSTLNAINATGRINLESNSINSYEDINLDKTVFGFFFSLEPGTKGGINLKYNLPINVLSSFKNNTYSLNVQKQAGRRTNSFKAIINDNTYQRNLDRDFIIIP